MLRPLEEWSKEELITELRALEPRRRDDGSAEANELRVHQLELEVQNRELRDAQQLLEESRSRYAELYDQAPIGYCTFDAQGVVRSANMEAARLFGTERADLVGKPLAAVVATDLLRFRAHLDASLAEGRRTEEHTSCELTLTRRSGDSVVVQLVSRRLDGAGRDAACLTTLTDISELKGSEQRLRLLSAVGEQLAASLDYRVTLPGVLRLLCPTLADVAFVDVVNLDGQVERFGRDDVELVDGTTTPQAEVLRSGAPLIVSAARQVALASVLGPGRQGDTAVDGAKTGSLMLLPLVVRGHALGVFTFVFGRSGRIYSAVERRLGQEIAARATVAIESARLYALAQQAIRAREDIVAVVSHDLNNPLHGIRLNCDHLLDTAPEQDRRGGRKQLEAIRRGINRMARMIRDLSELARIEAGLLVLERAPACVAALAGDALDLMRPLAEHKQVTLRGPTDVPPVAVDVDRGRVAQVLANLIGNGIKFTAAHGTVALEVRTDGEHARFTVTDDGAGIEPEQLPHVFERYFRGRSRRHAGSGLGLFIAKAIVDAHGGRMGIDSELGRGTSVWFTLPLSSRPDDRRALPAPPRATQPPDKPILVVDDDVDIREALADVLSSRGYRVQTAANGEEALRYLHGEASHPCLVLLDLKMPVMDGWRTHARLRDDASLAAVPVLVVSDLPDVERHALEMKAAGCLRKPIDVAKLFTAIAACCAPDAGR